MKSKEPTQDGQVVETLRAGKFKIELFSGELIIGHLAGRMRINKITVSLGDRVQVVVSGSIGRIIRRY